MLFREVLMYFFINLYKIFQNIDWMLRQKKNQTLKTQQQSNNQQHINKTDNHALFDNKIIKGIKFSSSSTHSFTNGNKNSISNFNRSSDYERLSQNSRIIKRIINPKRDKIILRSIQGVKKERIQIIRARTQHKNRNSFHKQRRSKQSQMQKRCNNLFTHQYQLKLENQRMGKRIIGAKSLIKSIGSVQKVASNGIIKNNSRINKGVLVFFNRRDDCRTNFISNFNGKTNRNNQLKQYYGFGPTILFITSINIHTNPLLKDEDLLFLQLIVNTKGKNKCYQTNIVSYEVLRNSKIKFALSLSKVGQFVPLRLWKVQEVDHIQLGIVDIQFSKYIYQQQLVKNSIRNISSPLSQDKQNKSNQIDMIEGFNIQINKQGRVRTLVTQNISSKLRKTKIDEIQSTISLQYAIYRKRYL